MNFRLDNLFIFFLCCTLLINCNDAEISPKEYPYVLTRSATVIEDGGVIMKAEVTNYDDIGTVTEYGFEITGSSYEGIIVVGKNQSVHEFEYELRTGLTKGESYQARAYALYDDIKVLGTPVSFSSIGSTSISIITPRNFSNLPAGQAFDMEVSISSDVYDSYDGMVVKINSDKDGDLGEAIPGLDGNLSFGIQQLSANEHVLKAVLVDSKGIVDSDSISISTLISLKELELTNNTVGLEWSKAESTQFEKYEIVRIAENGVGSVIHTIYDSEVTNYVDSLPPFTPSVSYLVKSYKLDETFVASNTQTIPLPDVLFEFRPYTVMLHPNNGSLYLLNNDFSNTTLIQFNYLNNEIENQIAINSRVGYADIGLYNESYELYLPGESTIDIYDASTLAFKDRINTGLRTACVVSSNSGFLVASVYPSPWWEMPVRTYHRQNRSLIDGNGGFAGDRIRMVPGRLQALSISSTVSPDDMEYFEFSESGEILTHLDDNAHGNILEHTIFRISTNGDYAITSDRGVIYGTDRQMTYLGEIEGNGFNDFSFSQNGGTIFAAKNQKIILFKYPELSLVKEIETRGIPIFIERLGTTIVAVSQSTVDSEIYGIELVEID